MDDACLSLPVMWPAIHARKESKATPPTLCRKVLLDGLAGVATPMLHYLPHRSG